MATVKLPGGKVYGTQMVMRSETSTVDVSLAWEFQKHMTNAAGKSLVIDQVKLEK